MKDFIVELWNGEPVYVLGLAAVTAGALAAAAVIPVWIAPVVAAVAAFVARRKVTPVK
jgi:hypothetical protein